MYRITHEQFMESAEYFRTVCQMLSNVATVETLMRIVRLGVPTMLQYVDKEITQSPSFAVEMSEMTAGLEAFLLASSDEDLEVYFAGIRSYARMADSMYRECLDKPYVLSDLLLFINGISAIVQKHLSK